MNKITAIVLAAGQGKRMNSQVAKQFMILQDKPVVYYSLEAFEESSVDEIILVTSAQQVEYCKQIVEEYRFKKISKVIEGGRERYDSVYHALLSAKDSGYVLIHDGARPFISKVIINTIISNVKETKACIIGTPVKETIKTVDENGMITATPNRSSLWAAQTPQAFDYSFIREAYDLMFRDPNRDSVGITDDAMVYENYLKKPVKMLMGDYNNLKLTTPEDLVLAEEILKHLLFEKKEQFFRESWKTS